MNGAIEAQINAIIAESSTLWPNMSEEDKSDLQNNALYLIQNVAPSPESVILQAMCRLLNK